MVTNNEMIKGLLEATIEDADLTTPVAKRIDKILEHVSNDNIDKELLRKELEYRSNDNIVIKKIELSLDFMGALYEQYDLVENIESFYEDDISHNNWNDYWTENSLYSKRALLEGAIGSMLDCIRKSIDKGNSRTYLFVDNENGELDIYFYGRDICSKDDSFRFKKRKHYDETIDEIAFIQFYMAQNIGNGRIGVAGIKESSKWYEKAAANGCMEAKEIIEKGNPTEKYTIALQLLTDSDNTEDKKKAIQMFEELVEVDDPKALATLGELYLDGDVCDKDVPKALEYLNRAILLGNANALAILGANYCFGRDVEKDKEKGVSYLNRAMEAGNTNAMVEYAMVLAEDASSASEEEKRDIFNEIISKLMLAAMFGNSLAIKMMGDFMSLSD